MRAARAALAAALFAGAAPPEVLSEKLQTFVERASAKALNDAIGEVIVKEPKIVNPATK
jgi:hypothetical protein